MAHMVFSAKKNLRHLAQQKRVDALLDYSALPVAIQSPLIWAELLRQAAA
jgi:hypothetical protein